MTRKSGCPGRWSAICAVLFSGAVLLSVAPASADSTDDAFVAALEKHGIVMADRNSAIATGHRVCAGLDKGQSPTNLVLSIIKDSNFSPHVAGYILGAAVASYCPQYKGQIDTSVS